MLRRRFPLTRQRAALLAHVQQTHRQYHLPESGQTLASKANRDGVADRFPEPTVPKSVAVDLALLDSDDRLLREVAWTLVQTAKEHQAQALDRLPSVPGIGTMVRLVRLYAIHAIHRCPRVQACVASCRLATCAKASAGKRYGTSGAKIGPTPLTWAFAEAAGLLLRNNPAAQNSLARLEHQHGQGTAFTSVAPTCARAVYSMRKRETGCERQQCLNG